VDEEEYECCCGKVQMIPKDAKEFKCPDCGERSTFGELKTTDGEVVKYACR